MNSSIQPQIAGEAHPGCPVQHHQPAWREGMAPARALRVLSPDWDNSPETPREQDQTSCASPPSDQLGPV